MVANVSQVIGLYLQDGERTSCSTHSTGQLVPRPAHWRFQLEAEIKHGSKTTLG